MAAATTSFFTLSSMPTGVSGVVSHFGDQHLAGRLMATGVLPGSRVEVLRSAPFGSGRRWGFRQVYVAVDGVDTWQRTIGQ